MTQNRFEQLSKEIVAYCQMNHGKTEKCVEFIMYELNLRTVSKDFLAKISEQNDDKVISE